MTSFTAFTTLDDQERAEALEAHVAELDPAPYGTGVFEIEDGSGRYELGAYFTEHPDEVALTLLALSYGASDFVVSELPDTDWVAHVRRELAPVDAGRFFVYGSHDADKLTADKIALKIDAAMAFGTGHHGTTLGCLLALDALEKGGLRARNVADIGCGTAVLGMAAAKLWPEVVLASDIDPVAVETAEANVRDNGLEGQVICLEAAGFNHPDLQAKAPYDLIFANILKAPLIALAPDMGKYCLESGHVILSGILHEQADDVIAAYVAQGFELRFRNEHGEWTTLVLQRG